MAVPFDPNKLQEDEQQQGSPTNQAIFGSSAASAAPAVASGTVQSPGAGKGTSSGSFTNLQSYLKANEGRNFGSQLANNVQQENQKAQAAQHEAEAGFKSQVDQSAVKYNPDLIARAVQAPTAVLSNQADLNAFKQMRDAQYSGPKALEDNQDLYNKAFSQTKTAADRGDLLGTEAGRKTLLGEYYNRPQYTAGQKNLDNLLVQGDKKAAPAYQAAQQSAKVANQNFDVLKKSLTDYSQAAANDTARSRQEVERAFTGSEGALPSLEKTVQNRLGQYTANRDAEFETLRNALAQNQLSSAQAQKLGLQNDQILYNLSPTSYLSKAADPSARTVATPEERAKYAALSQLIGRENTFIPEQAGLTQYDPNSAVQFNTSQFLNDLGSQKAAYDATLAATSAPIRQMHSNGSISGVREVNGTLAEAAAALPGLVDQVNQMKTNSYNPSLYRPLEDYISRIQSLLNNVNSQYGVEQKLNVPKS